jgi:hypothetical protein
LKKFQTLAWDLGLGLRGAESKEYLIKRAAGRTFSLRCSLPGTDEVDDNSVVATFRV